MTPLARENPLESPRLSTTTLQTPWILEMPAPVARRPATTSSSRARRPVSLTRHHHNDDSSLFLRLSNG
jgi:hypothetical protein